AKPMAFWQTKPRGKPTCGCMKWPPAPYHCFRPVIYNEPRNLRAYGDSDSFWRNERKRILGETKPTILAKATSSSLRESHSKSAKRSSLPRFKRTSAPEIDACASAANWAHEPLWRRRPRAALRPETGHEAGLLHHAGAPHAPQLGRDAQGGPRGHHPRRQARFLRRLHGRAPHRRLRDHHQQHDVPRLADPGDDADQARDRHL